MTTPLRYRFADIIRAERKRKKLTIYELADLAGVDRKTVQDVEHHRTTGQFGTVEKLFNALGYDLYYSSKPQVQL